MNLAVRAASEAIMVKLTERQLQVLRCIDRSVAEQGWPPSWEEMMDDLGIVSKNAMQEKLQALELKGMIQRLPGWRRVRLTPAGSEVLKKHAE